MASKRILIVEDETVTALHLQQELSRLGYHIPAVASSGEEAVRLAEELNPDLVLMDVKLAGSMDGLDASQRIREKAAIPIVYVTAYPHSFVQAPNRMQPPKICIGKPFSLPALQATIQLALSSS